MQHTIPAYLKGSEVRNLFGISRQTISRWVAQKVLIENVHYFKLSEKSYRYNAALIQDFLLNRNTPELHQKAIQAYLDSLPSNQAAKKLAVTKK